MNCPYGIKYETESKDFWKYCYNCEHCQCNEDSSIDTMFCDLEEN